MVMLKKTDAGVVDLERYCSDGKLTMPSDGRVFDYRRMFEAVKKLGRPLTEAEAEQYMIK